MIKRLALALIFIAGTATAADLPELTQPVNDFAHVIDAQSAQGIDRLSRALQKASGDVVVVATVPTIEGYGDIQEYATKLFENHGKGVGDKGKNNGLLIVVAVKERRVRVEVGYSLEEFITDRYAGETIRQVMIPEFRSGGYGQGLLAGTARIVGRIAKARGVTLQDVQVPSDDEGGQPANFPAFIPVLIFIAILIISRIGGGPGAGLLLWGLGPWSRWNSGVGSFGGGRGGWGGGGFGGGFGGFGGGGSGGGGASGGW